MTEGTDRPAGERRRRREAERAAERAAEQAGATRPLTRRELRWQQAEEAARLEAIATGELPLGQHHERPVPPPLPESAPSAASAPSTAAAPTPEPESAPSAPSASASVPTQDAPTAASAPSSSGRVPSRRSLRERNPEPTTERPQERTATGRRPVVRTPSTAQGIRALDATGQLTGIQPVARPDAPGRQPDAAPASSEETAVWTERATFSLDLDGPARAARAALPEPSAAPSAEEDEDDAPLRPRWVAIDSVSGASPDAAAPSRRSLRAEDPTPEPAAEQAPAQREPAEPNPAVTAVKVAVLVLVAAILGALIWLLATDAFAGSPDAAAPTTTTITTHLEESSAS